MAVWRAISAFAWRKAVLTETRARVVDESLGCRRLAPALPNAQSVPERIGPRSQHVRPWPISVRAHHTTPRLLLPRSRRHMVCKEETSLLTFPRGSWWIPGSEAHLCVCNAHILDKALEK